MYSELEYDSRDDEKIIDSKIYSRSYSKTDYELDKILSQYYWGIDKKMATCRVQYYENDKSTESIENLYLMFPITVTDSELDYAGWKIIHHGNIYSDSNIYEFLNYEEGTEKYQLLEKRKDILKQIKTYLVFLKNRGQKTEDHLKIDLEMIKLYLGKLVEVEDEINKYNHIQHSKKEEPIEDPISENMIFIIIVILVIILLYSFIFSIIKNVFIALIITCYIVYRLLHSY